MTRLTKVYTYLANLEKRIRTALTMFMLLLFVGSFVIGVGANRISHYTRSNKPQILLLVGLAALVTILILMIRLSRTSWLEKIHIKLDENIFGFLKRTNDTIFGALTDALDPEERELLGTVPPDKQTHLVQSIFAALSNDPTVFDASPMTSVFRNWTLYWILVYGTLTYLTLTVISFLFVAFGLDPYSRVVFTICWVLTAVHLTLVLAVGHRLVAMTRRLVGSMVESHQTQIAKMLRTSLSPEEEVEEADIVTDEV